MITRRQFLKLAGVAAVVPWGCARWPTVPAGVRCARTLRKRLTPEACEIVLFDREKSMVYYPLLAEMVGATSGPDSVAPPLRQLLPTVRFQNEEVHRIQDPGPSLDGEACLHPHRLS